MRVFIFFCSILILVFGCTSSDVNINRLQIRQNKLYEVGSSNPFTGKVILNHDDGSLSNTFELKNGIPDGKWVAFGYENEIVQEGSYNPIDLSSEPSFFADSVKRLNICFTREGDVEFTDIFLVTDVKNKKPIENEKSRILGFLRAHSIAIKGDTINKIEYVVNELED